MRLVVCGPVPDGLVPFAHAATPGEAARLLKELEGPALVLVTLGEEFAVKAAGLYRDKRFFAVVEDASLERWEALAAAGVTPLAPADVPGFFAHPRVVVPHEPVEVSATLAVEREASRAEAAAHPVRPVFLPVTAVTSLRGGAGKTTLLLAMAQLFRERCPDVPVAVSSGDPVNLPSGVVAVDPRAGARFLRGAAGLVLAERPFSPSLGEEFDRVLLVSRADGVSLGRLAALPQGRLAGSWGLVLNAVEGKVVLDPAALPIPYVAGVPRAGRGFEEAVLGVLRHLCGDDFVFAPRVPWWTRLTRFAGGASVGKR